MATFTIGVTGLTPRAKTITAPQATKLLNAYRTSLGQVPDGAGGFRARTDQETFDAFVDNIFNSMRETVRNVEGDAARGAVTPIDFT